jgi:hypothetical protein
MEIKETAEPVFTTDPYGDLLDGGYFNPEDFLNQDDSEKVKDAIKTVQRYISALEDSGKMEIG